MKFTTRSIKLFLMMAIFALGLQACGGGSSSTPPAGPLPDQNGEGIYSGTATVDQGNTDITDLKGMIYGTRIMVFSVLNHVLYDGTLTSVSSDDFTATLDVYENGVKTQTAVPASGKVLSANSIIGTMGTVGNVGNHNGTFTLNYDSIYERGATTARIEATGFNKTTGPTYSSINSTTDNYDFRITGMLFGIASNTCPSASEVYAIPDSTVNIYTIDNIDILDAGGDACPSTVEGSGYSGLITVVDDGIGGTDNKIIIAYSNGTNSVFGILDK